MITGPFRPHLIFGFIVHFNDHPNVHLSAIQTIRSRKNIQKYPGHNDGDLMLRTSTCMLVKTSEPYIISFEFLFNQRLYLKTSESLTFAHVGFGRVTFYPANF